MNLEEGKTYSKTDPDWEEAIEATKSKKASKTPQEASNVVRIESAASIGGPTGNTSALKLERDHWIDSMLHMARYQLIHKWTTSEEATSNIVRFLHMKAGIKMEGDLS